MTYGRVAPRCWFAVFFASLGLTALPFSPAHAASVRRPRASASQAVTLLALGGRMLQVQGSDGLTQSVRIAPASLFLRRGLLVSASDFSPGESVLLRKRAGAGGQAQVVLLCDTDSAAAIERYRGRPLTGQILSADTAIWVVQPADNPDSAPLTLRLSSGTTYHAGGTSVSASAFGPGATVTVTTRGLADGLLLAVSVTEAADMGVGVLPPTETRRAAFISGAVADVQASAGTMMVQDKNGAVHTVAVDGRTRVKVRKQAAALADIQTGMHVSVWLGQDQDASGNSVATTISASDATRGKPRPTFP